MLVELMLAIFPEEFRHIDDPQSAGFVERDTLIGVEETPVIDIASARLGTNNDVSALTTGWHALIPFNQFLERIDLNIFIVNVVRSSRLRRLRVILSVEFFASGERKVKTRREAFEGILPTKNEHLLSAVADAEVQRVPDTIITGGEGTNFVDALDTVNVVDSVDES